MTLTGRERSLMAVAGFAIVAVVVYTYALYPLTTQVAASRSELARLQDEAAQVARSVRREGDFTSRRAALSQRAAALAEILPGKHAGTVLVYHLSEAERTSGSNISKIQVASAEQGENWWSVQLELAVEGSFLNQVLFNQALEGIPLRLTVDRLQLETAAAPELSGRYNLTLYLNPDHDGPPLVPLAALAEMGRADPFQALFGHRMTGSELMAPSGDGVDGATPLLPEAPKPPAFKQLG